MSNTRTDSMIYDLPCPELNGWRAPFTGANMSATLATCPTCSDESRGYTGYERKRGRKQAGRLGCEAVTRNAASSGHMGYKAADRVDFALVNAAAKRELLTLLARWLPDGRVNGREYEARNPRRSDRNYGSFRVNLRTGRWADFATGDSGGDPISLAAFLFGLSQIEAARQLAGMLGVR